MNKWIKSVLGISVILMSCTNDAETDDPGNCDFIDFKYYNETKDYLGELSGAYILLGIDTIYGIQEIDYFISGVEHFDQSYEYTIHNSGRYKFHQIPLKLGSPKNCSGITQIITELKENTIVAYAHYTMKTDNCDNDLGERIGALCVNTYGSSFMVKVFDENDLTALEEMMTLTNTELVRQNEYLPKWFEVRATKVSKGDAMAMANYFYESELFEHSEPAIGRFPVE